MRIELLLSINACPDDWDLIADQYFQKIEFLRHCETYNFCNQRYYTLYINNILKACAVVYNLRINLLTFANIPSPLKVSIIGIPCSVSSSGIFGKQEYQLLLLKEITKFEKGFLIALNCDEKLHPKDWLIGPTLPTVIFQNYFKDWSTYLKNLNTDYRRRYYRISNKFTNIQISHHNCNEFNDEMYKQYLAVYNKSHAKLEKLPFKFFHMLNSKFNLTTYTNRDLLLGWNIVLTENQMNYFLFGGLNYQVNKEYQLYFNILFQILRNGIEQNKKYIDFGQTAEIPKTRLGGHLIKKNMLAYHHHRFVRNFFGFTQNFFTYNVEIPTSSVYKEFH